MRELGYKPNSSSEDFKESAKLIGFDFPVSHVFYAGLIDNWNTNSSKGYQDHHL